MRASRIEQRLKARLVFALAATLLAGVGPAAGQAVAIPPATAAEIAALPPPLADYHMHIQSSALSAELRKIAKSKPELFALIEGDMLDRRLGSDALKVLDAAGVRYGVLLSEAYMFASPLAPIPGDTAAMTRAENAFNIAQAKASKGRLIAFIGVDPLSPTAKAELTYWTRARGASGLKLHMGNSQLNMDRPGDCAALGDVFALAGREKLPIVIHLRGGPVFTPHMVNAFIDEVLPRAGGSPVQVAHGGGQGGLDEATVQSLTTFADAIEAKKPGTPNLTFDLTLVVLDPAHTDKALAKRFVAAMRRIGIERFAFGSDWPALGGTAKTVREMEEGLPLSAAEWRVILAHRAPWLPQ
jgi:predicted TIM-barrel fold metal-dependent hydrolase